MQSESSPDACQQQNMKMELDGWYINLEYGLNCGNAQWNYQPECRDRFEYKRTGPTLAYPLQQTTTAYQPNGQTFTTTSEVIELSHQPLDAALFDIPAGYTEAKSQQELYATLSDRSGQVEATKSVGSPPETSATSSTDDIDLSTLGNPRPSNARGEQSLNASVPPADSRRSEKAAGVIRVGVMQINNKAGASISLDQLRELLISEISSAGVESVALNTASLTEAQAEAKAKACDYILFTNLGSLKTNSTGKKLGGIFSRATGVDIGGGDKIEARLDFKLYSAGSSSATIESSVTGKEENQEASVAAAVDREAKAVVAAARKR
jgi:hypothetical protein